MAELRLTRASLVDIARTSPTEDPFLGEIYVDVSLSPPQIKVFDGSRWVSTSGGTQSDDTLALIIALS